MPIYEFRCTQCGHIQEILLTRSDEPLDMKCKECDGETLERILSQVSYTMGPSATKGSSPAPSATTRTCAPGKSCTTVTLPGHSRD